MSISLQVEITVKTMNNDAKPPAAVEPPIYQSDSYISADTDTKIQITVPPGKGKSLEVYVEAGLQKWLKFFAISPPKSTDTAPSIPFPKGFSFTCGDEKNETQPIDLSSPVAYWGDALAPLFDGLEELDKVTLTNPTACPIEVMIYFVRDVAAKKPPAEHCPPYAAPGQT